MYSNYYYSNSSGSLFESGIFLVLLLFILVFAFITYVIQGLALYTAAKAENRSDGVLAWIPVANTYLMLKLAGGTPLMMLLMVASIIPFIGWICSLAFSIYSLVMTYRLLTKYNVSPALVIVGFFIPIILIVDYFIMYKNAKQRVGQGNYNNYNNYDNNNYDYNDYDDNY